MGGKEFIIQCALYLLSLDVTFMALIGLGILIVCGAIRFIIEIVEDKYEGL